jgi:hypothetical protein
VDRNYVVLTHDLDFGTILAVTQGEKPSVVQIRSEDVSPDVIGKPVVNALRQMTAELVNLVGELHQQGVQFKSVTDAIDTGTPSGRFFFHVMASLAEMERELTVERTRAGLEVVRQLGRRGGRKRKMTDSKIESAKKLLASGVPPKDVAKNLGVSVPTLYRHIPASASAALVIVWARTRPRRQLGDPGNAELHSASSCDNGRNDDQGLNFLFYGIESVFDCNFMFNVPI